MAIDTTELSLASLELDMLEACVELMFFTAFADGVIHPAERAVFEKNALAATHGQLRPEIVRAVLAHFEDTSKTADRSARVRAIAGRIPDPRVRRAVLALAVKVAHADGALGEEERAFLKQAGEAFEIPREEVEQTLSRGDAS